MLIFWFSGTSEGPEWEIGKGKHQFVANSVAMRKLPTHPKYFNNGMVTVSTPIPATAVRGGRPR